MHHHSSFLEARDVETATSRGHDGDAARAEPDGHRDLAAGRSADIRGHLVPVGQRPGVGEHGRGTVSGWSTQRPDALCSDRGYDHDKYRKQVREAGIKPVIARRGEQHDSGLGVHRWVVEQGFALLHWFRRLRIRWEIRDDSFSPGATSAATEVRPRSGKHSIPVLILFGPVISWDIPAAIRSPLARVLCTSTTRAVSP
jgi:transposase